MNESLDSQVVSLLSEGWRPKKIGTWLSVSSAKVSRIRRKFGLPKCKTGFDPIHDITSILRKKESGQSYSQIGKELGVTRQRVQQIVSPRNGPVRGKCSKCGSKKLIHRHHTSYVNNTTERLCVSCHGKETTRRKGLRDDVIRFVDGNSHVPAWLVVKAVPITYPCLRAILREISVSFLCSKVPYHLLDWRLSDSELSEIWGFTAKLISWVRFRFGQRYGKKGPIKRQPSMASRQLLKSEYWRKYLLSLKETAKGLK